MKKGFVFLMLSFVILSMGLASAVICPVDGGFTDTECVCGHIPNSVLGYGQVIIGAAFYSCSNIADGLCPEDFIDTITGLTANCGSCADPDCTGRISGRITDESGKPIDRVTITGGPIPYNQSVNLSTSTVTLANGQFNGTFITGWNYTIIATKDSYTTRTYTVTVGRGVELVLPDLSLPNGTCFDDCTNVFGRCSAECDNVEFNASGTKCKFYNNTVRDLCNNKLKNTEVFLGWNETNLGWFILCCGDDTTVGSREQPYLKYYGTVSDTTCNTQNVVKVEKIARYNDVPVRVIITYWD
jgi:hypothetical protein